MGDNPRAFPLRKFQPGMTLRDYFAGQALTGFLACPTPGAVVEEYAADAYAYADAMLAERAKHE